MTSATPAHSPSKISAWSALRRWVAALPPAVCLRTALFLWLLLTVIICSVVAYKPDARTTTMESRVASAKWWGGTEPLYRHSNGYLYLPQAAILYTPYARLPGSVGEPLWRLTIIALLAAALWQAAKRFCPAHREAFFLAATIFVLPSTFAAVRSGQMNMLLASVYLFIALALGDRRWILAAVLLALSLALKPISLVLILLAGVLYPRVRLPLVIALIVLFALPFLYPHPSYVVRQYELFLQTFFHAGKPSGQRWCDFAGFFRQVGINLPDHVILGLRALAAVCTLGLAYLATKFRDVSRGAFAVILLSAVYLMLFNPRTEANSYVIVGAFTAVWGAAEFLQGKGSFAAWLAGFAFLLGAENYGWPIFPLTNFWAKALATAVIAVWLALKIWSARKDHSVSVPAL